jgi:hypothetical protein
MGSSLGVMASHTYEESGPGHNGRPNTLAWILGRAPPRHHGEQRRSLIKRAAPKVLGRRAVTVQLVEIRSSMMKILIMNSKLS